MWALCCVGIFFLQVGEFTVNCVFNPVTHMTVGDLQADSLVNSSCFKVLIKCSKVEPFCLGCDVYLKWGKAWALCPIKASGSYLSVHGSAPGPLFMFSDGFPLKWQQFSSSVQSIWNRAGYSGSYSGHSFHIGAATTATVQGVLDHLVKTLGRWSSNLYQIYIRTSLSSIVGVSHQLVA